MASPLWALKITRNGLYGAGFYRRIPRHVGPFLSKEDARQWEADHLNDENVIRADVELIWLAEPDEALLWIGPIPPPDPTIPPETSPEVLTGPSFFGGQLTVEYNETDGFAQGGYSDETIDGLQVLGGGARLVNAADADKVRTICAFPDGNTLKVFVYPSPESTWETLDVYVQGTAAAVSIVQWTPPVV